MHHGESYTYLEYLALCNPYHYRDGRTDGMVEEAFRRVPRAEIFEYTGIQFMQLNTVFQLFAMVKRTLWCGLLQLPVS